MALKFTQTMALATPTVVIQVKPMDVANKLVTLNAEIKRYPVKEAAAFMEELAVIEKTDEVKEGESFWASTSFVDALEIKEFILKHLIDFKKVQALDDVTGKTTVVPSVKEVGEFDNFFNAMWEYLPYRYALKQAVVQVLLNTSNNVA
jgi:hypothetical protein